MKDRTGSGAQYPWSALGSMEYCREQWCDRKRLPQVQICRLSLVRVWVTVGTGPQCCNGETFGPPIKGYIVYCKRVHSAVSCFVDYQTVVEAKIWFCYQLQYLTITSSWLIEHACNDPQGSTEREEYIVRGAIQRQKRDLREKILSCICGAAKLCLPSPEL